MGDIEHVAWLETLVEITVPLNELIDEFELL